jgi:outer membrane immunogenic protein
MPPVTRELHIGATLVQPKRESLWGFFCSKTNRFARVWLLRNCIAFGIGYGAFRNWMGSRRYRLKNTASRNCEASGNWRMMMKKFLLGTVGLVALGMAAGPASAADLAARPVYKAPPMVAPIYDWSGFYIGANGGWGESHSCLDFFDATGVDFANGCSNRSGGVVGGQFGYRWQASQWVFGLEAQGDWADLSNTRLSLIDPTFSTQTKTDGIGLFTGQIGYAWNASLFYFKGGAAVTDNRFSILSTLGGIELASASATRWGGTVGVGWEYGFAPNWSAGIEYDHLFMGNSNNSFSVVNPIRAAFINDRISQDVDMLTLRINYRFGGYGAPVAARY